jgi:glycosyltransferase involved in cell wall biosynthesis
MTVNPGDGLKLLILTADYPPNAWSGIAAAAANQALALAKAGAEVCVLTRFAAPVQITSHFRLHVRGLDEPAFPFRTMDFDCIHLHSLGLAELAFELRRRTGARIIYTAHSVLSRELREAGARSLWPALQLQVMRASDAVVVLSESERQALSSDAPEIARHAHVIPNPAPEPMPRARPYNHQAPVVFAGRFTANKGLLTLRRFLPALCGLWDGHVVLAGGHGDPDGYRSVFELQHLLGNTLYTPGWLTSSGLEGLLAAASLVLVPSRYEPFGMIAVEAMRMGAPVLASRVGGLAETVTAESGGCLVDSGEPESWRDRAFDILQNRSMAMGMAERGPAYVNCRFNPSVVATRLLQEVYTN